MGHIVRVSDLAKPWACYLDYPTVSFSHGTRSESGETNDFSWAESHTVLQYHKASRCPACCSCPAEQLLSCAERRGVWGHLGSQILSNIKRNSRVHAGKWVFVRAGVFFNKLQLRGNFSLLPPAVVSAQQPHPNSPKLSI